MCGIVGYLGNQDAVPLIFEGLQRLEYRGYDSAGIAACENNEITVTRAVGKLEELKRALDGRKKGVTASLGIGHTRWATHGKPSETNAHPHTAGRISLIHNGIIENYVALRERLVREGSKFKSETDTEIAAHLLNYYLEQGQTPFEAIKSMCRDVKGSYAFLAIDSKNPDRILVAKNATPIVIGFGEGEMFVASDVPAILSHTRSVSFLEDGDIAEVMLDKVTIENGGKTVTRKRHTITWDLSTAQKGGFKHFMLKEIHEQGSALSDTFRGRIEIEKPGIFLPELALSDRTLSNINRVVLIGCGTAWHACLIAKFYIEALAKIPCEVDYSSEFRYREPLTDDRTLVVAMSQSGETIDTLGALDVVSKDAHFLAICNVLGSSITRKVPNVIFTHAGPEISVASTKAFVTQIAVAYLLAVHLGERRDTITKPDLAKLVENLIHLPGAIEGALKIEKDVLRIANDFKSARDFLYLGRGLCYPIALEGALKLKEISYIHAEGYPAGEMKHGPIALINEEMPVVVVLPKASITFEKTLSNLREVESRGGQIIVVTDAEELGEVRAYAKAVIAVPFVSDLLSPIVLTVPLQLLAYHIAVLNGTDVDLPRNLAKSVTVE